MDSEFKLQDFKIEFEIDEDILKNIPQDKI